MPTSSSDQIVHRYECWSHRCQHLYERGIKCVLTRDHDLHYIGTVDGHEFIPGACDCSDDNNELIALRAEVARLRAALEQGCPDCQRFMQALGGSTARLYPDVSYEKFLDDMVGAAVDAVGDGADEGDEHGAALVLQLVEVVGALRRSRDELRGDLKRVALAAPAPRGDK